LGLKDVLRHNLLASYEQKENLLFLAPPNVKKKKIFAKLSSHGADSRQTPNAISDAT